MRRGNRAREVELGLGGTQPGPFKRAMRVVSRFAMDDDLR